MPIKHNIPEAVSPFQFQHKPVLDHVVSVATNGPNENSKLQKWMAQGLLGIKNADTKITIVALDVDMYTECVFASLIPYVLNSSNAVFAATNEPNEDYEEDYENDGSDYLRCLSSLDIFSETSIVTVPNVTVDGDFYDNRESKNAVFYFVSEMRGTFDIDAIFDLVIIDRAFFYEPEKLKRIIQTHQERAKKIVFIVNDQKKASGLVEDITIITEQNCNLVLVKDPLYVKPKKVKKAKRSKK